MSEPVSIQKQTQKATPAQQARTLEAMLETRKDMIAKLLPKHLQPERLIKVTMLARSRNPKLLECTPESFLSAFMTCAEMGLEPSGAVGGAHLVPRANRKTGKMECHVVPDYRGLVDIARRSGQIMDVSAEVIRQGDKYKILQGTDGRIEHEPSLDNDEAEPLAFYAVAKLAGGAVQFSVMTKGQVDKVRARSTAKDNGPWVTDYEEMGRKTVVKRLCKLLPRSRELSAAIAADDSAEIGDLEMAGEIVEHQPPPEQTQTAKVKQLIKGKKGPVIDVKPGETEEQAEARTDEPPPPTDTDFAPEPGEAG